MKICLFLWKTNSFISQKGSNSGGGGSRGRGGGGARGHGGGGARGHGGRHGSAGQKRGIDFYFKDSWIFQFTFVTDMFSRGYFMISLQVIYLLWLDCVQLKRLDYSKENCELCCVKRKMHFSSTARLITVIQNKVSSTSWDIYF